MTVKKAMAAAGMLLIALVGCSEEETMTEENPSFERAELGNHLEDGHYQTVYDETSGEFQNQVPFKDFEKLGKEFLPSDTNLTRQSSFSLNGQDRDTWISGSGDKGVLAVFDETETIVGLQLLPLESHPETDESYTDTSFQLPFNGEWLVYWGGTNVLLNYHYEHESQRYAYDFLVSENGQSFSGDATKNESFSAFGKEVIAPAGGTVVKVVDGIQDNTPVGAMNADEPAGNYVVIDHGNEEYGFLAHFQEGTIQVEEGMEVEKGDLLGSAGNSGNSSEPHIHFHVSDTPELMDGRSIRVKWDGDQTYTQGQMVSN
ncbi:M23 family metallopeptidase [Halobacillus litoralis]|uniref:M23 family metallopeptidase n=1 Tax=Halobacillus litoralis TaxID=45668 RepID=UPI001CD1B914|nr:M23 family metallopeptidase [Halobacillus litoralis]MCA0972088.1 M23 family metallopeptidase [Halobacillus litoralis]